MDGVTCIQRLLSTGEYDDVVVGIYFNSRWLSQDINHREVRYLGTGTLISSIKGSVV